MARRERRIRWVRLSRLLLVGALLPSFGCGEDDPAPKNEGPTCPHDDTTVLTLTGVSPAPGSSVSNSAITHTFTTVGVSVYLPTLVIGQLATHTAGAPPAGMTFTVVPSGSDVIYTFMPFAWPTAPGHVALFDGGLYVDPNDGCKMALPNPLFEYDVVP
jgi:hypothetical protein